MVSKMANVVEGPGFEYNNNIIIWIYIFEVHFSVLLLGFIEVAGVDRIRPLC